MSLDLEAVTQFFSSRARELKRIVNGAKADIELGDVQSEAWIEAKKLEKKRGFPFNFLDLGDQDHLLARLYLRLVKYADKTLRFAVRLDTDWDQEESTSFGATLSRLLAAPLASDPQAMVPEPAQERLMADAVQHSYSQAAAYVLLLIRFEWDARELAVDLRIARDTLRCRLRRAGHAVSVQASLFDKVEKINQDFQATKWAPRSRVGQVPTQGLQGLFLF